MVRSHDSFSGRGPQQKKQSCECSSSNASETWNASDKSQSRENIALSPWPRRGTGDTGTAMDGFAFDKFPRRHPA
jgi:hypothetical protein